MRCQWVSPGDLITVLAYDVHFLLDPLILKQECELVGEDDKERPVIMNRRGKPVFYVARIELSLRTCVFDPEAEMQSKLLTAEHAAFYFRN